MEELYRNEFTDSSPEGMGYLNPPENIQRTKQEDYFSNVIATSKTFPKLYEALLQLSKFNSDKAEAQDVVLFKGVSEKIDSINNQVLHVPQDLSAIQGLLDDIVSGKINIPIVYGIRKKVERLLVEILEKHVEHA
jgi:hypothetical protein